MWEQILAVVVALLGVLSVFLQRRGSKWSRLVELLAAEIEGLSVDEIEILLESTEKKKDVAELLVARLKANIETAARFEGLENKHLAPVVKKVSADLKKSH